MLFLPAAALCCLCSALVAMAAQLSQEDLSLTRRAGETVSFSCRGTEQCSTGYYVIWFQKKDTETFTGILDIDKTSGTVYNKDYYNHPQKDDFSPVEKQNNYELQIQTVQLLHSAAYYCSCWHKESHRGRYLIFLSGTKLFVDEQVVKPVVSVYRAASRAHLEGKSSLLCLASAMSPPLVQFSWKRQKKNGPLEELTSAEGEQLELREPGRSASILLLHQQEDSTYKYSCYVKHEGSTVRAQTEQEFSTFIPPRPTPTSPPALPTPTSPPPPTSPAAFVPSQYQVLLLCVLYTVLIVKSLVYCCGLSLLMILRNKGPSTNCTHAD
ncbi:immunoglobulin lambda-1 light chain-like [Scomber japonicus]|uniref:immunoglobulin lambda-1 light chain-like n=1 Tax=Scomber japonicus TaxID=13676 RepID=UPI002306767E|nr:immunoglobulin lambda-1 light chain-like [Scomber japonicus]